jgi:Domain of unknown function (DUF4062)/NB-ARC domain
MKTSRVFVSHTSDLAAVPAGRSFVQGVLDAVARAGMVAVDMRYFAAREGQPADYCQQRVRECDVYVAVVGFRYGSLVPGEAVSYTELEFIEAGTAGLPRLVFLLDETADLRAGLADMDRAAVDAFRQRLLEAGLICVWFATVDGLDLAVFQALKEWAGTDARTVPRQLPAAVQHFAGRTTELAALTGLLRRRAETGGTVVISAIGGTAGVGKTALAVYWAHQVADRFPDGQLYVNLRGFDPAGTVVEPAEAVRRFLDAVGVPPERIPADLDAQAALYRSQLAGRRMLVVLDNARDTAQVRPLLPGAPTCLVLVTSRNQLSGLVAADGAHPIILKLLTPDEAQDLLTRRLGPDRTAAEPEAVEQIITACARLPLALAIVAAQAATHPHLPLATLASELCTDADRLGPLTTDDPATDVRAVFSWSYHALIPEAARLFRLLGLHPGPDISTPTAASLAALPTSRVRLLLAELARANLIVEPIPGRYGFHDLLRAYAADLAHTVDTDQQRHNATHRILDHYLHTAYTAERLLNPARDPITLSSPQTGVAPEQLVDHRQALDWFTTERPVLLATVDHAATTGWDTHAGQLTWTLTTFLGRRGHWHDQVVAGRAAVAAAQRLADPPAQARAYRTVADAYILLGVSTTPTPSCGKLSTSTGRLATRSGKPTPTRRWPTCGGGGAALRGPSTTLGKPSTSTGRLATRSGKPAPSTTSAGVTRCWATTSRPSSSASRPSPCTRNPATVPGRPTLGTASATPTTTSASTPEPPPATSTPSSCTEASATATSKPTPSPASVTHTRSAATMTPPVPPGGRP